VLADPVLAADVGDRLTRFRRLQHRDDLLPRELALPDQLLLPRREEEHLSRGVHYTGGTVPEE